MDTTGADKEAQALLECTVALSPIGTQAKGRILQYLAIRLRDELHAELKVIDKSVNEIEGWMAEERIRRDEERRQKREESREAIQ